MGLHSYCHRFFGKWYF